MNIIYPSYLNDAAFKFRHVKIHIVENADKLDGAAEVAESLIKKSDMLGAALKDGAKKAIKSAAKGGIKDTLKSINDTTQAIDKAMGTVNKLHTIVLPLPNSLTDAASHDWSVDTGVAKSIMESVKGTKIGAAAAKTVAIAADMSSIRKPLADPGYFQNYAGTNPRDFSMSFDLVPNNATDAGDIWQIIHLLKKYSSPSAGVNHAIILAPHYFQIELTNPFIDTMLMAKDVVLKSISIDYGADGHMQQTADGMPKHIKLDLTFAERKMMTNEMYGG